MSAVLWVQNFEFIRAQQPALATLLSDAEQMLGADSCCFLLKVRLALELWCHDFADLHGIALALDTTLAEKLEVLRSQKIFPQDLLDQLLQLRQHANSAVHIQQDARGRHITMQPLDRARQLTTLKCMFELVGYTKRYHQSDSELPLWQVYPKQNMRVLLSTAYGADPVEAGTAAVQLAQVFLQQLAEQSRRSPDALVSVVDVQYWLERGLRLGSSAALSLLTELVFSKGYSCFDMALLNHWLQQYRQLQPSAELDYRYGQVLERQNQQVKALQHYQTAAKAGHHAAIKRLLEYWGTREPKQLESYLQLGLQHNEPQALLTSMALLLVGVSHTVASDIPESMLKKLKGYLVKARVTAIAGFGYIEGLCYHLGILGYPQDQARASQLVLANYQKVPSYCQAALNVVNVLLAAEQYANAVSIAPKALAQLDENRDRSTLAKLEFDIAMALLQLHEQKAPVPFVKTPQQLLQSAAKRGYHAASKFLNSHVRSVSKLAKPRVSNMPSWATQLAARGARVNASM